MGVRNTWPAMVRRAASMSAMVMLMPHLLPAARPFPDRPRMARVRRFGRGRHAQIRNRPAISRVADFGIAAEVADQDHLGGGRKYNQLFSAERAGGPVSWACCARNIRYIDVEVSFPANCSGWRLNAHEKTATCPYSSATA